MSPRRNFTSEYTELVIKHGYQVKEEAKAMTVGLPSLQRWLRQYCNEINGTILKATAITLRKKVFNAGGIFHWLNMKKTI